jgi:hypothetical protein
MIGRKCGVLQDRVIASIPAICFVENRDEHRRNVLQKIFGIRAIEEGGVLSQFIRHLIDDEAATGLERLVCFLEQGAFLFDLENAEWNARENVIALRDAAALEFLRQSGGIGVDYVDARIIGKLPAEIARKCRIEFEQEQLGTGMHAARDLARMHALPRTVLSDDSWAAEIDFSRNSLDKRLRAGNNGGDLEWPLQKSLEEQDIHEVANFNRCLRVVQSRSQKRG